MHCLNALIVSSCILKTLYIWSFAGEDIPLTLEKQTTEKLTL